MRAVIPAILSIAITSSIAFFVLNKDRLPEGDEQGASIGGLPVRQAGLPKTTSLSELDNSGRADLPAVVSRSEMEAGHKKLTDSIEAADLSAVALAEAEALAKADKYLAEALPLVEAKDRFVLIDKITGFSNNYEFAAKLTGSDPVNLEFVIRATARYVATWSPFYYYIHPDAQSVLGPVIKTLEKNRAEMLKEFVKQDLSAGQADLPAGEAGARQAGKLAASDIEYYIEDIRKSAARRNSDFITFSLQDYEMYRKTFDGLAQSHKEFLFGFAESAHIVFDDFYRMHEEVDGDYMDKTRKKIEDVRLELRGLHKKALLDLEGLDRAAARAALDKTILAIENELALHDDWREELHDIMKSDYDFYKAITL